MFKALTNSLSIGGAFSGCSVVSGQPISAVVGLLRMGADEEEKQQPSDAGSSDGDLVKSLLEVI